MSKHRFQSIILKLQAYWAEQGCLVWQPYYTQVGAGTMNPATFLRVLGPEPWKVAYVEPSVRPDDGRYGENPNRFQVHYQFQVILKPDTGNPQELYLDSLQAIGIDPRQHDIRFVEDNWAQPAISAWGLGWEVWLDGQEITQFTYFQQVGGLPLDPVAVEITYGLERILIALNNADAIWDEPWNDAVTYGEIRRPEEFEHSKYYFEVADIARVRQMYQLFEAEAEACLEQGLALPAHDYVLKCSHTFNILDTRGAIGPTERQAFFHRMRTLARRVAETYLAQREAAGFPLLATATAVEKPVADEPLDAATPAAPTDFLLEIGVEELPPADVTRAVAQLRQRLPSWLDALRLEWEAVQVEGTPRRLAVQIRALAPQQKALEQIVKGPPADRAFDADGKPTRAAEGFARSKKVAISELEIREIDGGRYVVAVVRQPGRPTAQVLQEALPTLIAELRFPKSMRWLPGDETAFSRPIRWLVALLGETVIPFRYAGLQAGRQTRGLRPYCSPRLQIDAASDYASVLAQAGVVLEIAARRALIQEQVQAAAASVGGQAMIDENLLDEVVHLVEKPLAFAGRFDADFLSLPREVLIGVMRKHQRYFPVIAADGALLPYFIAVRNGDAHGLDIVRQGNEHVLGARFADAAYFVREDRKHRLEDFRPRLARLTFQSELGSMLDKNKRLEQLAPLIGQMLGLDAALPLLARAAYLAKADLATQMVTEMTSLQGIMGREYALHSGEAPEVATAIGEQYLPVPQSRIGLALALADRLDSLVGLFAVGLAPTGNKDPFALRRAALGVVLPLIEHNQDFDLRAALAAAAEIQPVAVEEDALEQVLDFIRGRLRVLLQERGGRHDVVAAILSAQGNNPAAAARETERLQAWVQQPEWAQLLPAYARCVRILRAAKMQPAAQVQPDLLQAPSERALFDALEATAPPDGVDALVQAIASLAPHIQAFFDEVLVIDPDPDLQRNRLALVQRVAALADGLADLSQLEGF